MYSKCSNNTLKGRWTCNFIHSTIRHSHGDMWCCYTFLILVIVTSLWTQRPLCAMLQLKLFMSPNILRLITWFSFPFNVWMRNLWHAEQMAWMCEILLYKLSLPITQRRGESSCSHLLLSGRRNKQQQWVKDRERGNYLRLGKWVQRSLACQVEGGQGDSGGLECVERLTRPEKEKEWSRRSHRNKRGIRRQRGSNVRGNFTVKIREKKQCLCESAYL